ncbi:lipase [Penicillium malachiteum]|uniref:lipase n=1 Tax=Penicillium malachiteum TaxID=1324776 RepID=UPI00254700A0|nr:lipase [Penicillium malachiteum]KAJ5729941.1 lipase [Penicillium malachiteum]
MGTPRAALTIAALAVAIALLANHLYPANDQIKRSPTVHDSSRDITYVGSVLGDVEHFQNIFYGEEPTGPRRFAPPVPVNPPRGSILDATKAGAWCPQGTGDILPFTSRITNISENCLSLRIARSRGSTSDRKLPVVVYLHGGGHALGSALEILYTPNGLIEEASASGKPLIYVGINYRLGLFGFATSKTMIEKKQTNAGLRDQRAALEWIRDNIEAFGGDPNRVLEPVTLALHLVSYNGTRGVPFQQAMMMSGAPGLNFNSDPAHVTENTASIAKEANCVSNEDAESLETLECLQRIPFEVLTNLSVTASRTARPPFGEGFFYPTIDGDILPGRPSELLRAGKVTTNIPLMASWATNDGAWYAPPTTATDKDVLASFGLWLSGLSESTQNTLLGLYPLEDFTYIQRHVEAGLDISPQYYRAAQINRDIWFTCPVLDFTWNCVQKQQHSKDEEKESSGGSDSPKAWLYEHNATRYAPVYKFMGVPMWGVAHLSDIPYVFNSKEVNAGADNSVEQLELARKVSRRVIAFAYTGSPEDSESGTDAWPVAFDEKEIRKGKNNPEKMSVQVFGLEEDLDGAVTISRGVEPVNQLERAMNWEKLFDRCDFINSPKMRRESGV